MSRYRYSSLPGDENEEDQHLSEREVFFPSRLSPFNLSHLLFTWVNTLIKEGKQFSLPPSLYSKTLLSHLTPDKSLWRGLYDLIQADFLLGGLYLLLNTILLLFNTMLIKYIVRAVSEKNPHKVAFLSVLILLSSLLQAISLQQYIHLVFNCGSRVVSALTSRIFHACLSLRLHSIHPPLSLGSIQNIQGKDANSMRDSIVFAHNLWNCPMLILLTLCLLTSLLGIIPTLAGALLFPLLLPIESYLSQLAKSYRRTASQKSDCRMNLINEMIEGIRTVKLTNLSRVMQRRITNIRNEELSALWLSFRIDIINTVISQSATIMVTLVTFLVYVSVNRQSISAEHAFTSLTLISALGRPMKVLPKCISMYSDTLVAMQRIDKLLLHSEKTLKTCQFLENTPVSHPYTSLDDDGMTKLANDNREIQIAMRNVVSLRPPSTIVLKVAELTLTGPGLVLLHGPNASGKTSFLLTILDELILERGGSIIIAPASSNVAYCAHESWILNTTVKQNILIGRGNEGLYSIDEQRYAEVLRSCALSEDLSRWELGDETLLGEKGLNISGGQKARIALARALYSNAPILLLDNLMTSLDAETSVFVLKEAILRNCGDRLVILSSHQTSLMHYARGIIEVNEGVAVYHDTPNSFVMGDTLSSPLESTPVSTSDRRLAPSSVVLHLKNTKGIKSATVALPLDAYVSYVKTCSLRLGSALLASIAAFSGGALSDFVIAGWTDGEYSIGVYLTVYSCVSGAVILLHITRQVLYTSAGLLASSCIHTRLLDRILGATISYFSATPSGAISSCFSADFSSIDRDIPSALASVVDAILGILVSVGVVIVASPFYILAVLPLIWMYMRVQSQYRLISKVLKRNDAAAKEPLYSHFFEAINGLEVIRGYNMQNLFIARHHELMDLQICARLNWDAANRWLGIQLDLIGVLIVFAAAFCLSLMPNCSAGLAGLTISYAIRTTQNLSFAVRAFTALENTFTSPERVFRLMDVPQEATTKHQLTLSPGFHTSPFQPTLVAENIYCKYHVDSEPILKGVSFKVYPQLTGICGRTGGGKSTLALVISRCLDETQGRMTLCGVNVLDIPLERYRSLVQVYPQDCFLLSGTVRSFLDPHLYFTDLKLNSILNELSTAIGGEGEEDLYSRPTLSSSIHSGGSNLSAGQKQLLALARAALATEAKIVILDEITSNMDARAALKAIHILRNELLSRSIAVILIAHVIKDILACNVVFVMADGLIVEQGKPDYLLSDSESALTQMVKEQEQNAVHSSSRAKG